MTEQYKKILQEVTIEELLKLKNNLNYKDMLVIADLTKSIQERILHEEW